MNIHQASTNLARGVLELPNTYSSAMTDTSPSENMDPMFWDPTTGFTFDAAAFGQPFELYPQADPEPMPENAINKLYPDAFDNPLTLTDTLDSRTDSSLDNYITDTKPPSPALAAFSTIQRPKASETRPRKTKREPRKLRTAHRRVKSTSSTHASSIASAGPSHESDRQRNARLHNDVEKAYRARLNGHFEALLAILPSEASEESLRQQRLSKAMVLDLARRRIGELTVELGALRQDIAQTSEMMGLLESGFVRERTRRAC